MRSGHRVKTSEVDPGTFVTEQQNVCFWWLRASLQLLPSLCTHISTFLRECQVSLCCRRWCSQSPSISAADPGSHHCSPAVNHHAAISGPIWAYLSPLSTPDDSPPDWPNWTPVCRGRLAWIVFPLWHRGCDMLAFTLPHGADFFPMGGRKKTNQPLLIAFKNI